VLVDAAKLLQPPPSRIARRVPLAVRVVERRDDNGGDSIRAVPPLPSGLVVEADRGIFTPIRSNGDGGDDREPIL
jgi:hypothetical protein